MDLTVVVPTYERAGRLRRLLVALADQDHPMERFEVVVVDDASGDDTAAVLEEALRRGDLCLRVLRQTENGGPAPARNAGARAAKAEVVAFIDDDCTPDRGWVSAMVDAFRSHERLGVAQGRTIAPDGPRGTWVIAREVSGKTPWFEGCNIAYRREALLDLGGFDEAIGWYGEDTALGWRVVEAGWARSFVGDAAVTHDLEERGVRWRIRHAWLEANLVSLAAEHPGLRAGAFRWRWGFRRESATLPIVIVALVLALTRRQPLFLALAAPYARGHRSLWSRPHDLLAFAVVDSAAIAGHLCASARHRILVV